MMYLLTTSLASSEPLTYLNSQGAEKLRVHAWLILAILVDFSHLQRGRAIWQAVGDPEPIPRLTDAFTQTKVT